MEAFVNEVLMAYGNWRFLMLTSVLIAVGLVFLKGYKKRFVVSALILSAVILNPVFYTLWYKFNDRSYWRMMWMVPIIPVCVIVSAFFVDKSKKDIVKVGVLMLATAIMVLCGRFIYDGSREVFASANNPEKLPGDVVAVGEALLELDDEPYVVTDADLSTYLRQYSGRIKSYFSRNIVYGRPSNNAIEVYTYLTEENMHELAQKMIDQDYEYLVTQNSDDSKREAMGNAGFELLKQIDKYGIYRVKGYKHEVRTYNDFHQVTSITLVDDDGNKINSENGYAVIRNEYDSSGNVSLTYFYDSEGEYLECGSSFLHEYLCSLKDRQYTIFISVKDDASKNLTSTIINDLKSLGISTDLRDYFRYSYCAVIAPDGVLEKLSNELIRLEGTVDGIEYSVVSAGFESGSKSSIILNGDEYSKNCRGLNIVVLENGKPVESIAFDTYTLEMSVTR